MAALADDDRRLSEPRRTLAGRRLDDLGPTDTLKLLAAVLARETTTVRAPLSGESFLKPGWDA